MSDMRRKDIPKDRECCWNCRFATITQDMTHLDKCEKKQNRKYYPRTYKCKDFYNKEWPIKRAGDTNDHD